MTEPFWTEEMEYAETVSMFNALSAKHRMNAVSNHCLYHGHSDELFSPSDEVIVEISDDLADVLAEVHRRYMRIEAEQVKRGGEEPPLDKAVQTIFALLVLSGINTEGFDEVLEEAEQWRKRNGGI